VLDNNLQIINLIALEEQSLILLSVIEQFEGIIPVVDSVGVRTLSQERIKLRGDELDSFMLDPDGDSRDENAFISLNTSIIENKLE